MKKLIYWRRCEEHKWRSDTYNQPDWRTRELHQVISGLYCLLQSRKEAIWRKDWDLAKDGTEDRFLKDRN